MGKRWFGVGSALLLVLLSSALGLSQAPRDVTGTWSWECCKQSLSGTIEITTQTPEGHFKGIFHGAAGGTVEGDVRGNTVKFTREGFDCCDECQAKPYGKKQTWTGEFVRQSKGEEISGQWEGCRQDMHPTDFYLRRSTR